MAIDLLLNQFCAIPARKQGCHILPRPRPCIDKAPCFHRYPFEACKVLPMNHCSCAYCDCCGHPLSIAHRKLTYREDDIYRCMHHHYHPESCPRTHAIYHSMLYPFILTQLRAFAKSMRRRKIQSSLAEFGDIAELTPEILRSAVERIEVGHVTSKSFPSKVVRIYWKLT